MQKRIRIRISIFISNYIFFHILLIFSPAFAQSECSKVKLKEVSSSETILTLESCYEKSTHAFMSKSCLDKKCDLFQVILNKKKDIPNLEMKLITNGVGNPGFVLCQKIGAESFYIVLPKIFNETKYDKVSVCVLKSSQNFVDMGTLLLWAGF